MDWRRYGYRRNVARLGSQVTTGLRVFFPIANTSIGAHVGWGFYDLVGHTKCLSLHHICHDTGQHHKIDANEARPSQ